MMLNESLVFRLSITIFQLLALVFCQDTCPAVRYKGRFEADDFVRGSAIIGNSYKNLTANNAPECFGACVSDCRCMAFQLFGTRCELLDADRKTDDALFKPRDGYTFYPIRQEVFHKQKPTANCPLKNGCCRSSPCLNGGQCTEVDSRRKFRCDCRRYFTGRVCEVDLLLASMKCVYSVTMTKGNQQRVICDNNTEPGMLWSLIESFSMNNSHKYLTGAFSNNLPSGKVELTDYRLPRAVMQDLRKSSTHWRVTCNFNNFLEFGEMDTSSYLKGLLSDVDILTYEGNECVKVQNFSIMGIKCTNCSVHLRQNESFCHPYVDISSNFQMSCSSARRFSYLSWLFPRSDPKTRRFGFYSIQNNNDACSTQSHSTTQWWMGRPVQKND